MGYNVAISNNLIVSSTFQKINRYRASALERLVIVGSLQMNLSNIKSEGIEVGSLLESNHFTSTTAPSTFAAHAPVLLEHMPSIVHRLENATLSSSYYNSKYFLYNNRNFLNTYMNMYIRNCFI